MIIGTCPECGEYEITSYDGDGCINIECSRCVLSITTKIKIKREIRRKEDKKRKKLLDLFKRKTSDDWFTLDIENAGPPDFFTNPNYIFEHLIVEFTTDLLGNKHSEWVPCSNKLDHRETIIKYIKEGCRYRYKEEKTMNKKEKALEELNNIKERMEELERIIKEPEGYPCVTTVSRNGDILFNDKRQLLKVNSKGLYVVDSVFQADEYTDYRETFEWTSISRSEVEVGDTLYISPKARKTTFLDIVKQAKVLKHNQIASIYSGGVVKSKLPDSLTHNFYKLVKKEK